ncbi:MAG: hypothetical protein LBJ64_10155 [Deltaproteobacteria bacterium]|nr:hypothetical protein [Deltaproteobacteria bacterium]
MVKKFGVVSNVIPSFQELTPVEDVFLVKKSGQTCRLADALDSFDSSRFDSSRAASAVDF